MPLIVGASRKMTCPNGMEKDPKPPAEKDNFNKTGCLIMAIVVMIVILVVLKLANILI